MLSKAQPRTHVLPSQKDSCHQETLPALPSRLAHQPLPRQTARSPSLQLGTIWAESRALQQTGTLCHGCPRLPSSPRLREGLLDSTSLALATSTRHSLFLQRANAPGLPGSIFSSKGRSSPEPVPGAGKGAGQVAITVPGAGKFGRSAGEATSGHGEEFSTAGFSSVHLMRLPCFISETNEYCATLGGRDGERLKTTSCIVRCTQYRNIM